LQVNIDIDLSRFFKTIVVLSPAKSAADTVPRLRISAGAVNCVVIIYKNRQYEYVHTGNIDRIFAKSEMVGFGRLANPRGYVADMANLSYVKLYLKHVK
jgi:hypothetical protein